MRRTSVGKFVVLLLIQLFTAGMVYIYCHDKRMAFRLVALSILGTLLAMLFSLYIYRFDVVWVELTITVIIIGLSIPMSPKMRGA